MLHCNWINLWTKKNVQEAFTLSFQLSYSICHSSNDQSKVYPQIFLLFDFQKRNTMKVELHSKDFVLHEEIGAGGFGTVYKASFKASFRNRSDSCLSVKRIAVDECKKLAELAKPKTVTFVAFLRNTSDSCIIIEAAHDNLTNKSNPLSDNQKGKWIQESALGIQFLHAHNWLHRDIMSRNILLDDHNLKFCDSGLARQIDHSFTVSSRKGTYQYTAPKRITNGNTKDITLSEHSDIFAFSMLILEICQRSSPFNGTEQVQVDTQPNKTPASLNLTFQFPANLVVHWLLVALDLRKHQVRWTV